MRPITAAAEKLAVENRCDGERKLPQLVEAAWGITDFIGHFEIEQLFEEGCSFCIGEDVGEL